MFVSARLIFELQFLQEKHHEMKDAIPVVVTPKKKEREEKDQHKVDSAPFDLSSLVTSGKVS